jgi:O-6-methylguanine DNA methyltransferase
MIGIVVIPAPWGPLHLAASEDAVLGLEVLTTLEAFAAAIHRRTGETAIHDRSGGALSAAVRHRLAAAAEAVQAHLAGERGALAGLAIDLPGSSPWDRLVLDGVRRVGWGEVTSYGRLARSIGRPGAARAAGGAVGRNPVGLIVPCHRVIAGDGSLGGYGGGWGGERERLLEIKRSLLALEGVAIPVAFPAP